MHVGGVAMDCADCTRGPWWSESSFYIQNIQNVIKSTCTVVVSKAVARGYFGCLKKTLSWLMNSGQRYKNNN